MNRNKNSNLNNNDQNDDTEMNRKKFLKKGGLFGLLGLTGINLSTINTDEKNIIRKVIEKTKDNILAIRTFIYSNNKKVNKDNPLPVKQSGSIVEKEILTTLDHTSFGVSDENAVSFDIKEYREFDFIIYNRLRDIDDNPIEIGISFSYGTGGYSHKVMLENGEAIPYRIIVNYPRCYHKIPSLTTSRRNAGIYLSEVPLTYHHPDENIRAINEYPYKRYFFTDDDLGLDFRTRLIASRVVGEDDPVSGEVTIVLQGRR